MGTKTFVKESGYLSLPTAHNPPHARTIHSSFPDQSYSWEDLFRPAPSPVCQDTSVFVGYIRHWPISWINHSINSPENLLIMKLRLHVHCLPICEKCGCRNCIKEMVLLGVKVMREQKWYLEPEFSRYDHRAVLPPSFEEWGHALGRGSNTSAFQVDSDVFQKLVPHLFMYSEEYLLGHLLVLREINSIVCGLF